MGAHLEFARDRISMAGNNRDHGETCLLFLPAWCESSRVFTPLAARLQSRWRTLTFDLPGHNGSPMPPTDFGYEEIAASIVDTIEHQKLEHVIPIAHSHSGWLAIELRRRLGNVIPKLVLLDWIIMDPAPQFIQALKALQNPERWRDSRNELFATWLGSTLSMEVVRHVRKDMGSYKSDMWARGGREILRAYQSAGSPLKALSRFSAPAPTIHIYSQPRIESYLRAQMEFAVENPWFSVRRVDAFTHFPTLEVPETIESAICDFIAAPAGIS
jgi:pimeloyl-ACP methyl ester carboxylesterase